ncbi:hypothetical protein [Tabrizicola sp.]|uniref:hypothetical protein n=1 Tax=Tabrizicola sp. TaxID=2005166 RepID=UPI003F2FB5CA
MTDIADAPDASTEVASAVRNLMPALRRMAFMAAGFMVAAAFAAGMAAIWVRGQDMDSEGKTKLTVLAIFVGGAAIYGAYKLMQKRQEALVMPLLATAVGLSYSKEAGSFVSALPVRLLPARGIRKGEDHVQGKLGAHAIQMAEVHVETGGKNSRTLFKGIVAQFPNRAMMPAFFIALEDKTRPGMFFGGEISTDGLNHLRNVSGNGGRIYGIWTSRPSTEEAPTLAAAVEVLTRIENHLGYGTELYAATSNGEEMHVALSHKRNLFRLGGLFPNEDELFQDVRAAMQDLTIPLTLAKALIEAEEAAMSKAVNAS